MDAGNVGLVAEDIAEDFVAVFQAGPGAGQMLLNRDEYLETVKHMHLRDAFPDFTPNLCNFAVDSILTNRVWIRIPTRGSQW